MLVPWYRYGMMERTCRWSWRDAQWDNGVADGEYVDVPTATTFLSLLSAPPAPLGPNGPTPKQVRLWLPSPPRRLRVPHLM